MILAVGVPLPDKDDTPDLSCELPVSLPSRAAPSQPGCLFSPIKPLDDRRSCIRFHQEIENTTTESSTPLSSPR